MNTQGSRSSQRSRRNGAPGTALAILLLLLTAVPSGHADEDWMRVATARTPDDVSIWTRYISGQQMKQFRGETHAQAPLEQAIALLLDVDAMPGWLWRCESARVLTKVSPHEYIVYLKFSAFWPLADRDAVLRVIAESDPKNGSIKLTGSALPDYLPKMPGSVRVPAIASSFVFQPTGKLLRMEMTGHFDPGGVIPLWAANLFVTVFPKHSMSRMREVLEGPYYASGLRLKAGKDALAEMTTP